MILAFLISLMLLQVSGGDTLSGALARTGLRSDAEERVSPPENEESADIDVGEIIFDHIGDEYEWHITQWKGKPVAIPLPCIVIDEGVHVFE